MTTSAIVVLRYLPFQTSAGLAFSDTGGTRMFSGFRSNGIGLPARFWMRSSVLMAPSGLPLTDIQCADSGVKNPNMNA